MQTQVKEWGNSQGIRLPKEALKSAGFTLKEVLEGVSQSLCKPPN